MQSAAGDDTAIGFFKIKLIAGKAFVDALSIATETWSSAIEAGSLIFLKCFVWAGENTTILINVSQHIARAFRHAR
jgi:hypothetical protein